MPASRALSVKQMKMTEVASSAVGMMLQKTERLTIPETKLNKKQFRDSIRVEAAQP